jgi:eukaryotic-like serine/threonine-protein kinase
MNDTSQILLPVGTVLHGKWVIIEFIAKGGMGEVYRAHQVNLKRDEAIKIISKEWLDSCEQEEEEFRFVLQRFRQEVQSMAQIRHPNILQIYDHDSCEVATGGQIIPVEYLAMEFIPGGTLWSTMSEQGFYPEEDLTRQWITTYFLPILDGVQALHDANIVHRDLKPGNVLMDVRTPKITDFGLARSCRLPSVTRSVDIQGTPQYMPSEQFIDLRRTDHRTDIYSLGKILYESIAGKMDPKTIPFRKASLKHAQTPLFQELDRIIQTATAEDREERHGSVAEFRETLLGAIANSKAKPGASFSPPVKTFPSLVYRNRVPIGIIMGFFLLALAGLYWHRSTVHTVPPSLTSGAWEYLPSSSEVFPSSAPSLLEAPDGVNLRHLPGGEILLPVDSGTDPSRAIKVNPFYMDETQVTNYQYMEFLNMNLPRINVEQGVVKGDGEIWLLLGEVVEGYEPIIFREDKFHVNKSIHAACPVLRVTGHGASAYARFFGRRLPTREEWIYAFSRGATNGKHSGSTSEDDGKATPVHNMHGMTHESPQEKQPSRVLESQRSIVPYPVMLSKPNGFGIRGLNESAAEWAMGTMGPASKDKSQEYMVIGSFEGAGKPGDFPSVVPRQPWEAFERVGFRCVLEVKKT